MTTINRADLKVGDTFTVKDMPALAKVAPELFVPKNGAFEIDLGRGLSIFERYSYSDALSDLASGTYKRKDINGQYIYVVAALVKLPDGFHDSPKQPATYYPGQVLETPAQFKAFCEGLTVSQKYWYLGDKKRLCLHGNQAIIKYELEDGKTRHLPVTIHQPHPDHLAPKQVPNDASTNVEAAAEPLPEPESGTTDWRDKHIIWVDPREVSPDKKLLDDAETGTVFHSADLNHYTKSKNGVWIKVKPEKTGPTYYLLVVEGFPIGDKRHCDLQSAQVEADHLFNKYHKQVTIYQAIEAYTMPASVQPTVTKLVKKVE